MNKFIICIWSFGLLISCSNDNQTSTKQNIISSTVEETPIIAYSLVKTFPHDTTSYTQGFLIHDKYLFESTGSPINQKQTKSVFGILDTSTGKINVKAELDRNRYFGEGIAILKNKVYQLTWKNQTGFIYDAKTFKSLGQFSFANKEGWGLTTDGTYLIMSDGTHKITYINPSNLKVIKTIEVTNNRYVEDNLNELEFINGYIYANVYQKNYIVKIDTSNGNVTGILDLSSLVDRAQIKSSGAEVLNGIAFDSITNRIFVTGKLWPDIYQIDFVH